MSDLVLEGGRVFSSIRFCLRSMLLAAVLIATAFLAYANGANDNFKGVATLYGSGTLGYKAGLAWATVTTLAGSAASILFAKLLVARFSGKGLVPDAFTQAPEFLLAVALGAGATVIVASIAGFPISTTHSLTGALVGTGLVAVGMEMNFSVLGGAFLLPLLVSPLFAAALSAGGNLGIDRIGTALGARSRVRPDGSSIVANPKRYAPTFEAVQRGRSAAKDVGAASAGEWRVNVSGLRDIGHLMSGGIVSFARGLNDTPKIVALLLVVQAVQLRYGVAIIAIAMAAGGLLHARRVAEVMSRNITTISPGRGFAANVVTGLLVVAASKFGLPVSTTHVSVGAIFGLGAVSGDADWTAVWQIVLSWVLTLPIAAFLSGVTYAGLMQIL